MDTMRRLLFVLGRCEEGCPIEEFQGLMKKEGINLAIDKLVEDGMLEKTGCVDANSKGCFMLTPMGRKSLDVLKTFVFKYIE